MTRADKHVATHTSAGRAVLHRNDVATGRTPLHDAAECADAGRVSALLETGADASATDTSAYTPSMYATSARTTDALRILGAAGADLDAVTEGGTTAMIVAAVWGRDAAVMWLLDTRRVDPNHGRGRCTALHAAVVTCTTATVEALLDAGADSNAIDACGDTPLARVARLAAERPDVARALVEAGADPNFVDREGRTFATIAATNNHWELVALASRWTATLTQADASI